MSDQKLIFKPIPNSPYVPLNRIITINGTSYDLSKDRSWTISTGGTVSTVSPLSGDGVTPIELNYNSDFIIDTGNLSLNLDFTTLPSISLSRTWNIYKSDGVTSFPTTVISGTTIGSTSTNATLTVPAGCQVVYNGTATIGSIGSGQQAPTSVSGSYTWSPNPPTSYPAISTLLTSLVSLNSSFSVTLSKPKSGLIVSGSQVIRSTGNDTSTATDSVTFSNVFYWGYDNSLGSGVISQSTANTLSSSAITGLSNYKFGGKSQTLSSVTDSSGYRLIIAYLASYGNISNIILNGSTSITGAFLKRASDVSITTLSGSTETYRVYIAVADNSYPGSNSLVIS